MSALYRWLISWLCGLITQEQLNPPGSITLTIHEDAYATAKMHDPKVVIGGIRGPIQTVEEGC